MHVELISVKTSDGVLLDGALRIPETKPVRNGLPVDIVILHHGVGGSFYKASFHDEMGDRLLERGCAVLRVNNRGHDLAYNAAPPHKRLGAAFETVADCRLDWKAWTDFAGSRGYSKIGVWGHSLGAVKTIFALANDNDARVARAVASSPPRFSHSSFLARHDGDRFAAAV
jgi:dipeptidyl aminopeptidase/acylaminoacyl peptidase